METQAEQTFEGAVIQLEQLVEALESGELSLDQSLQSFEQAVSLARFCRQKLEAAEAKIAVLTAEAGLVEQKALPWEEAEAEADPFTAEP
jgi:exodeoxyribonuclease VII small subunit